MDGRRHSVDVPITKALIALRRVRSLRDPSTNATSKYFPGIEDQNWETNSYSEITLGFQENFHGSDAYDNGVQVWRSSNFTDKRNGSRHCSPRLKSPKTAPFTGQENVRNSCVERVPFEGFNESSASCNETDEISQQNGRRKIGDHTCKGRRKKHYKLARVTANDDIYEESPHLSMSNRSIGSSVSPYEHTDGLAMDSCHQGCGLSSCWSRTPKYRDMNLLHGVEELPLLTGPTSLSGENFGVSPYTESPRSLCQKFMPKLFNELVGQSKVASSLLAAVSNKQISSLHIFEGPRGTGKTSASRIFAAALNCLSSNTNKPCGFCQECVLFFSGRSVDVKEVDSLKLNRTERCRMLVKNAKLPPICSKYKVYIVDECQMLNRDTWAHLLSCLEDLPRRAVFVMITPNLDKLPRTALTMSQIHRFQKLREADVNARLESICVKEGVDFEGEALTFMAKRSNGSLRDAEMMLDHLILLGKKITVPLLYEVNGVISDDELADLLYLALSSDATNTVKRARELMSSRIDPLQLISQLANLIMDILAGKCPAGVSEAKRKIFGAENSEADMQQLSHALKVLSQTEKQLRTSKNQSTWLTAALLQLGSSPGLLHDENSVRLSTRSINPADGDFQSTTSTGESLKHALVSCPCDENTKNCKMDLDLVWQRATSILASRSLQKFLYKRGKLASIRLFQGITVAELEFARPKHLAKAEKYWKVIASALQRILGYNVELRINLCNNNAANDNGIFKKSSFGLFNCSKRTCLKPQSSAESSYSVGCSENSNSLLTPSKALAGDHHHHKYVEAVCSLECGSSSQLLHGCCHGGRIFKSIRDKDGNSLSVDINQESKPRKREYMKVHCWRSAMFPFRKAWNLKNHHQQQRNEQLVDYAVHCAAAN